MVMVIYADEVETKEKLKLPEIKTNYNKRTGLIFVEVYTSFTTHQIHYIRVCTC